MHVEYAGKAPKGRKTVIPDFFAKKNHAKNSDLEHFDAEYDSRAIVQLVAAERSI